MVRGEVYLYWMTDPDWYDYDDNDKPYLTDKAPEKAQESFQRYLELKQIEEKSGIKIM